MNKKLLATSALVSTLAFSSVSFAQTTITGSLDLTYNALSKDLAGGLASTRGVGRESQINIQNKGKLNVGGLDYAAGFALEFDGQGSASNTVTPVARFLSLSYLISVTIEKGLKVKLPVAIAAGKVEDCVLKYPPN